MPAFPEPSIIIPCFRSGYRLHDQVFALRDQEDRPGLEVLLCDTGRNRGLTEWVANFPHDDPDFKVRLIDATDHSGAVFARNRGIAAAQADLLAFCDDDLVHPRSARSAVGLLQDHPVITGGVVSRTDEEVSGLSLEERRRLLVEQTLPVPPCPAVGGSIGPALMGGNFAARREVLLQVGGFDATLVAGGADNDLAYRLDAAGVPIIDCGEMSILYVRRADGRRRLHVRRRPGMALAEAASARGAWHAAPEFRHSPLDGAGRAGLALGLMAAGCKERDLQGTGARLASAAGLSRGWLRHRVLRRQFPPEIGASLRTDPTPAASEGPTLRPGTTVLVVAYNHQAFVRETLESILHQTRQPTAVLIAEDASPGADGTAAVVADVLSHAPDSWQYLPNPENIGLNRTLNKLLARVDTEFVTYIAADDTMAASRIEAHEDLLRASSPDAALAYSDATVIDQDSAVLHDSSRVEFPWPDEPDRSTQTLACLVRSNWIPAASLFLRTAVLRAAGGYAEDLFYEDYELLTRLAARHPFVYTEEPLVAVRRLATSLGAVGFAHDSPRFIRSLTAALGNAVDADDADVRADAQCRRWELAKRAKRVGMPRHEVLRMMWNAREGSQSPSRALAHMVAAAARPSRAVKRSSTH